MRSRNKLHLSLLRFKVALLLITPLLAYGAAEHIEKVEAITGLTWTFIGLFSMLGWMVAEVDKVAELWNLDGKPSYEHWKARLLLVKGIAASNAAGISVYFLAQASPALFLRVVGIAQQGPVEVSEMYVFLFVSGAGYMGARWFAWLERKFFNAGPSGPAQ